MFKRITCVLLLFILIWIQCSDRLNTQAAGGHPSLAVSPSQQQPNGTQNTQEIITLERGKSVERELTGGQKHSYQIDLAEGEYASIEIDSRGISAAIRLFDPTGEVITQDNADPSAPSKKTLELVAEAAGRYRLDVEGKSSSPHAQTYAIRLTAISPAPEKELWLYQARRAYSKALTLWQGGKYDEGLVSAEKALALRERALGPDHPEVARSLLLQATLYVAKGDYQRAESLCLRALGIWEITPNPASTDIFRILASLGAVYHVMGDSDKSEQFLLRALKDEAKLSAADYPLVVGALNNLALVYKGRGDYSKAEALYERALAISEKALGLNHTQLGALLLNLGALNQAKGDYVKAESFGQRTLTIYEKGLGPDHPSVADPLINLGNVYYLTGELGKAEILYQRALQISKKSLGPEHPTLAYSLNNLGEIHRDRREFAQAEKLFEEALAILVKRFGENHTRVAAQLNNLGNLYRDQGDYSRAESFYQRALASREKLLGPEHPDVVSTLANIALLHMARGSFAEAAAFQSRVIAISERNADLNLVTGSERQKLAYLDLLAEQIDRAITLNVSFAPDNAAARTLAVTTVLQRKGRVQDALSDSLAALRRQLSTTDAELLDRFNKLTSQLARLVLGGPQRLTTEEHQKQVSGLREQREHLETEISRRSVEFRARSQVVTIEAVQAAVPENAALLEFVAYNRLLPKGVSDKERRGESRYVVYIIRNRGDVQWKELGEAKSIDEAIDGLRSALRDPKRNDVKQLARAVDEKIMQPVRALLGQTTQLLISPDGELNLLPFAALADERGRYLIERYSVTYLTSGRDLLRMQVAPESKGKPLVVANPSFGEPATEFLAKASTTTKPTALRNRRRSVTVGSNLSEVYFASLGGTAQEARAIQTSFPDANLLTGAQATESAVKRASGPRLLHFATHGFFLQDTGDASGGHVPAATRGLKANASIENPLLRSGLALAEANSRDSGSEDGILTALEASGLNLWGTKLVVLSACDTGLGEVRNGEGVYGLRRAFVLAGAESLVMSLWPVSDNATRKLMASYYQNLKQGMGRGESLRQVQLDLLKRNAQLHPFYWANFIQSGEWANLDGKR
jgi:CHAT domain-containing protein/Tfp pilus assembly protein PilF